MSAKVRPASPARRATGDGKPPQALSVSTWPQTAQPVVTVICMTYNHQAYIRECLDSFLRQETSFPVEILVHDDASTDETPRIVREYADRYPGVIRPVLQTENQRSKLGPLLPRLLSSVKGEFFAFCEGDDYWTFPEKLERQVALLRANPKLVMVSHECRGITADGGDFPRWRRLAEGETVEYTQDDVLCNVFNHPNTWVCRAQPLSADFLRLVQTLPMGDDPLNLYMLHSGGTGLSLGETWSVYRQHAGGIWSTLSQFRKKAQDLALYQAQREFYGEKYRARYDVIISNTREALSALLAEDLIQKDFEHARQSLQYLGKLKTPAVKPVREISTLVFLSTKIVLVRGIRAAMRRTVAWIRNGLPDLGRTR